MLKTTTRLLAFCISCLATAAQAQNNQALPVQEAPAIPAHVVLIQEQPDSPVPEARAEHIQITENLVQVDELRVRGETQIIQVTPQGTLPAYEVIPQNASQQSTNNASGQRVWRIRF